LKSAITNNFKECYCCGSTENIEKHHVIHGKIGRKLSVQYRLVVPLCESCHRGKYGIHGKYGYEKDLKLKSEAQQIWEEKRIRKNKSNPEEAREEWLAIFGIDYVREFVDYINECKRDFITEEEEEKILEEIHKEYCKN
jgi:hypothetical protein